MLKGTSTTAVMLLLGAPMASAEITVTHMPSAELLGRVAYEAGRGQALQRAQWEQLQRARLEQLHRQEMELARLARLQRLQQMQLEQAQAFYYGQSGGNVAVRGHIRRDGAYVPPHVRTAPDGNFYNNWSTWPNANPYSGQPGTQRYPRPVDLSFNSTLHLD